MKLSLPLGHEDAFIRKLRHSFKVEPHLDLAIELLREAGDKALFVDGGANLGSFVIPLTLWSEARFLAVEAQDANLQHLIESLAANHLQDRGDWLHAALWSHATRIRMEGDSAYAKVSNGLGRSTLALSLDEILSEMSIAQVSLVKLDIEGAELQALRGATKLLDDSSVDWIFEANTAQAFQLNYSVNDLLSIFESSGYSVFLIRDKLLVPRTSSDFQEFPICDYLATRKPESMLPSKFRVGPLSEQESVRQTLRSLLEMGEKYRLSCISRIQMAPLWIRESKEVVDALRS